MALRVLLADESTTIKKVMQLALQDFAVEVKAVHSGIDVIEVARSFQPDVVFADVLLQKRNGYEVCGDVKRDRDLRRIPVVLMWSSFMDLDEKAYVNSGANNKLEKPFDVENLRSLILELVPKTQSQRLAHFLKFPAEFIEPLEIEEYEKQQAPVRISPASEVNPHAGKQTPPSAPPPPAARAASTTPAQPPSRAPSPAAPPPPRVQSADRSSGPTTMHAHPTRSEVAPAPASSSWNMDSFEDLEDFSGANEAAEIDQHDHHLEHEPSNEIEPMRMARLDVGAIPQPERFEATTPPTPVSDDAEEPWAHQDLARFKLDIPTGDVESDEVSIVFDLNNLEPQVEGTQFLLNNDRQNPRAPKNAAAPPERAQGAPSRNNQSERNTQTGVSTGTQTRSVRVKLPNLSDVPSQQTARPQGQAPQKSTPASELSYQYDEYQSNELEIETSDLSLELDADQNEQAPPPSFSRNTGGLRPSGQVAGIEGEVVSQFAIDADAEEHKSLELMSIPEDSKAEIPALNAEQLERIIRAQSEEIIASVVRRIVPDLASELIKKELDRLLTEKPKGGG